MEENKRINVITNVTISDMAPSVIASGYPMKKTLPQVSDDLEMICTPTEKAYERCSKLANAPVGSGHDCFLKGIRVSFDLTFSEKAWPEAERYTWLDIVSSMSTMHMITKMKPVYIRWTDEGVIRSFEKVLNQFLDNPTDENKLRVLYSYPSGLLLTARVSTNYLQLKTIYNQRKTHFLPEWREFCDWIETLPHSEWITGIRELDMRSWVV